MHYFFFDFGSKGPLSPHPPQTCFYFYFLVGSMIIGSVVFAGLLLLLLVCSQLPFSGGGGEWEDVKSMTQTPRDSNTEALY